MSQRAVEWAWAQRCRSPGDKLTLLALATLAHADGECWPSARTLANWTGLTVAAVHASLKRLEAHHLIERVRRTSPRGLCLPTLTTLFLPEPPR